MPREEFTGAMSEKDASSAASGPSNTTATTNASAAKARSCIVCRHRKVRCDKQSPCGNCRRAKIPCVLPSTDRPPRWARHLENQLASRGVARADEARGDDMEKTQLRNRVDTLENIVQDLSRQLQQSRNLSSNPSQAQSAASPSTSEPHSGHSPAVGEAGMTRQVGRLVLQDQTSSRYVSGGFWSKVDDEIDKLNASTGQAQDQDFDTSEDEEQLPTTEMDRAADRYTFLFQQPYGSSDVDLRALHPMSSQAPFLFEVFSDNVNFIYRIVHEPTAKTIFKAFRTSGSTTSANEALMFAIYYAAITAMEEDDVLANFGATKSDLSAKYRLGLELALARADFLNSPNLIVLQALTIFLFLARRHDAGRWVWHMTGLVVRMACYLGLQRDGTHFKGLTPLEVEVRRRLWWAIVNLDLRAAEDQGTEPSIVRADCKVPSNVNDQDLVPDAMEFPPEREGWTDASNVRVVAGIAQNSRRIVILRESKPDATLEDHVQVLDEIWELMEKEYLPHTSRGDENIRFMATSITRLVMAKLLLLSFMPILFDSPNENVTRNNRTSLLIAAIEIAEHNHNLNANEACKGFRWQFQTHTHTYCPVFLALELTQRPWSPLSERAWVALQSKWLLPTKARVHRHSRIWVPLQKLLRRVRQRRVEELQRLKVDTQEALRLDVQDLSGPMPSSHGPAENLSTPQQFRQRWRQLVGLPTEQDVPIAAQPSAHQRATTANPAIRVDSTFAHVDDEDGDTIHVAGTNSMDALQPTAMDWPMSNSFETEFDMWLNDGSAPGSVSMYDSLDMPMDLDGDIDWHQWANIAKSMDAEYP